VAVDEPAGASEATRRRAGLRLSLAVGVLAVVALGALTGWLGWRTHQTQLDTRQRQAYLQAAQQGALNLTTIDHNKVDADVQRILDSSTGAFHDDFQDHSAPFVDAVKQAQSTSVGTVNAAGLESVGDHEAQAVVAVAVRTSLAGAEQPQARAWRMRITVAEVGNEMEVSNVAFVP
jgi:Mce-associated membrane protein